MDNGPPAPASKSNAAPASKSNAASPTTQQGHPDHPHQDSDWDQIQGFVGQLAELSTNCSTVIEFARGCLPAAIGLIDGRGALWWSTSTDGQPVLTACFDAAGHQVETGLWNDHSVASQLLQSDGPTELSIRQTTEIPFAAQRGSRATGILRIAVAIQLDGHRIGALEFLQDADLPSDALAGNQQLLALIADQTEVFLRRHQVLELTRSNHQWRLYESLTQSAHGSLDLERTAYQIACDGRVFVGCDRVSVVVPRGSDWQVAAISGIDTVDSRSALVVAMQSLSDAVAISGQWLRYRGSTEALPPQLETPLCEFLDQSHSRNVDVIPLLPWTDTEDAASGPVSGNSSENAQQSNQADSPQQCVGLLILEDLDAIDSQQAEPNAGWVRRHKGLDAPDTETRMLQLTAVASSAIRNALQFQAIPLRRFSKKYSSQLGENKRRVLWKWLLAVGVLIVICGMVPITHQVRSVGNAQPTKISHVFAPSDASVFKVLIDQATQNVTRNQKLIEMRSPPLEQELQRLLGEDRAAEKQLLAVSSERVQRLQQRPTDRNSGRLAAEEQELLERRSSLQAQIELVNQQIAELMLTSPISGRVLTWDPDQLLADRPVTRGQRLLSVANLAEAWEIELLIPDHQIGHLLDAQAASETALTAQFTVSPGDGSVTQTTVSRIGLRSEVVDGQAVTKVTLTVPPETVKQLRPGTTVEAKVNCGRKSLWYVWTHDIWLSIRRELF